MKSIFLPPAPLLPALAVTCLLTAILSLQAQPDRPGSAARAAESKYALEQPPSAAAPGADLFADGQKRIIFRLDDAGLCHAVNVAVERILKKAGFEVIGYDLLQRRFLDRMQAPP